MPRPISHFRSIDNPHNKTLCGYPITRRYNIIHPEQIRNGVEPLIYPLCARCRVKAERLGWIPRYAQLDVSEDISENSSSDDKQLDTWLLRLGIL
ncbi:MAG: hypothetical protein KQ78_00016 [Candidatus Izimaplasma bacterium HR2]|nr:MAG: hypothetical protein KQ78_00016 [Candidatus Izimaplasma bacterium HR2]